MDLPGNDSEDSVELSSENISAALDSLASMYNPQLSDLNMQGNVNGTDFNETHGDTYLTILEQPQSRGFRFRYKCEGPSHGGLQGLNSEKGKKTYPKVQIMNYEGPAKIIVSLVTDDSTPKTHAHELVGKSCDKGICLVDVKEAKNPTFQFQNIGVMHVTKRKVADVLKERISESMLLSKRICSGDVNDQNIILNDIEIQKAKEQADSQAKSMHLNVVRLCFQAYIQDKNGNLTIMLPSVISNPIYDSKSPGAAALKICRMDKCGGCCRGNEEVFLLCEKVQKDDIKVLFIEMDQNQSVIWEKEANFGPTDVHKQYAIVFKTPEYRNINIKDPVKVLIKLQRPSDLECSEPKVFTYYPWNPDEDDIDKKRRKVLPRIPDSDSFYRHLLNPATSDWTYPTGLNDPSCQFPNGGADNMNFKSHALFSSDVVSDSGLCASPHSKSLESGFDIPDGHINYRDLEVDSTPCDSISLKPYTPIIYTEDNPNSLIKKEKQEDLKGIKLSQFKEDDQIRHENPKDELKKKVESCTVVKKLPAEVKIEPPNPEEKPASVDKNILNLDLLMSFRTFCASGSIRDLLMENRNLMLIPDKYGDNCLHLALLNNQSGVVQNLLPVIAVWPEDLNTSNHRFQTGLHLAVLTNQPDMVELLLKQGMKRTLVDCHGNTAVHLAVKYNYIKCLKSLLKLNTGKHSLSDPFPELDMLNSDGYSPLHLACLKGSMESVELLIESKAEVNLPDGKSGRTPLHIAVEKNDLSLAGELLIEAECETDCVTYDGNTPLHLACGREYYAMVALLLSVGADPEVTSGMTDLCLSDDSDFESSADEDQWLDDIKGTRPRDLVLNNEKILHLLNGDPYKSAILSSDTEVTDFLGGDLCQLSTQMRINLADLIDSAEGMENWKSLAKQLDIEYLIDEVKTTRSPTLSILDMYEMLGGQLKDLYSAIKKLKMDDAACLLNQVMR